ncbi:MAG: hypothetical protein GY698_21340 [Actinomycetia bacterium]|nr:hypothetical protein [Actinomycetes bacterium]
MSGIFGVVDRRGTGGGWPTLQAMAHAMEYWGPDGIHTWSDEAAGLGQCMLSSTTGPSFERPHVMGDRQRVIVAAARIDNRVELCGDLDLIERGTSNTEIILAAYEKWGDACPDRLLGDWSFAIWDPREQSLFLARDHLGNTGLYYHQEGERLLFASSLHGLLAVKSLDPKPNMERIAQLLVAWGGDDGGATMYQNIRRLPPAHSLRLPPSGPARLKRFWVLEDTEEVRLHSDDEYLEGFLDVYGTAVACRTGEGERVASTLSGGLDSGSVSVLAARELRDRGDRLAAYGSVPMYPVEGLSSGGRFGDERPFIEATARYSGNVDVHFVTSDRWTPMDGVFHQQAIHLEPGHAAGNQFWIMALLEQARNDGVATLLTGQGGNPTVSWHGAGYFDQLARRGRWIRLAKELKPWIRLRNTPWRSAIKAHVLRPILGDLPVFRRTPPPHWSSYSALHPAFAKQMSIDEQMRSAHFDATADSAHTTRENRHALLRPTFGTAGAIWHRLGAGFGMDIRDPTLDRRVIEFCLGIPDDQYVRNGEARSLIRRSMHGLLPDEVRLNRGKGVQSADIGYRVRASRDQIAGVLDDFSRSDLVSSVLDLPKMQRVLASVDSGIDRKTARASAAILLRGSSVGHFLRLSEGLPDPILKTSLGRGDPSPPRQVDHTPGGSP